MASKRKRKKRTPQEEEGKEREDKKRGQFSERPSFDELLRSPTTSPAPQTNNQTNGKITLHSLSDRREPARESKRLGSISPELSSGSLLDLDESEVNPSGEESKLDDDVRVLSDEDGEDVGDEEVDSWESLEGGERGREGRKVSLCSSSRVCLRGIEVQG